MRWITRSIIALFFVLLLLFWVLPLDQVPDWMTWLGILLITACSLYLSLAYRHILMNWRSFGILVVIFYSTLLWLAWQWSLWNSSWFLLRNLNTVVCLLAWALGIGVGMSSLLLLIYRDASLIFLGATWMMCPLLILGAGIQYEQLEQFSASPLGQQLPWGISFMWMIGVWCLAPPAFLLHFGVVIYKELKARRSERLKDSYITTG